MTVHEEFASYIDQPVTPYRKEIFDKLIRRVSGGRVCDLGCHAVGHYWALGYAERVDDIALYDLSEDALKMQQYEIDMLSPDSMEERFGDTLRFLRESNITNSDLESMAFSIQEKIGSIRQFNFLTDEPDETFDWVLALESLGVVNTREEYETAFHTAKKLMKPGNSTLFAIHVPYETESEYVEFLRSGLIEGRFNPSLEVTNQTLESLGFSHHSVEKIVTNEPNYPIAHFITARW